MKLKYEVKGEVPNADTYLCARMPNFEIYRHSMGDSGLWTLMAVGTYSLRFATELVNVFNTNDDRSPALSNEIANQAGDLATTVRWRQR